MIMNWKDISIEQYLELGNVYKIENPLDRTIAILSIINDKEDSYYYNLPIDKLKKETSSMEFLADKPQPQLKNKIKIEETEYILNAKIDKWTAGQYIDYMNIIGSTPIDFGLCMAILYIPKGKAYGEDYDVLEVAKLMNTKCPIEYALGISDFFLKLLTNLTEATLLSLKKKIAKVMKKEPTKVKPLKEAIKRINQISGSYL